MLMMIMLYVGLLPMIVKIRTKKQFLTLCVNLDSPTLVIGSFGSDLLNTFWIVKDEKGTGNSYELEGCQLSGKEYRAGELNNYWKRRSIKYKKYIKWMEEKFGENYKVVNTEYDSKY